MNKASLYNKLVYETLAYYVVEQIPFQLQILETKELKGYLPETAFANGALQIDFKEWILEEASVLDTTLECIVVYGEVEYPLSIDLVQIDSIIDLAEFYLVLKKTLDTEGKDIEVIQSYVVKEKTSMLNKMEERAKKFEKVNKEGIELSTSKLSLLKVGEPEEVQE